MIVLDHYEQDMFQVSSSGQLTDNFARSKIGRTLMKQIIGHPQKGINTKGITLDVAFFYDRVPEQNSFTKGYIKPHVDALQKSYGQLIDRIQRDQPNLIVTYGHWFSDLIAKKYKLDQSALKPQPVTINGFQTYISFCPSPKKYHFMKSTPRDKLIIINHMINRFLKGGLKACEPQMGQYKLVTKFDQVKTILTKTVYRYPIVAVDFETNTLHTYLDGAKAIMMSLSWKDHQGVAIPLDHRLAPNLWTKDQFNQIIDWIKKLMDDQQWKVLHNCIYDIHMLMDIYGLEHATHCVDTMLMYYELVDESQGAQRGLKHLAYLYTDMGGYEDTRDEAFQKYLDDYYNKWLKTEMAKYEAGKRKTKPSHRNYVAPTNQIDGAAIDFEWLPMEVVYPYASADTDVTLQIYHKLKKLVHKRPKWHYVIYEYYPKLCDTLSYMQHVGFQVNQNKFKDYKKHFNQDIKDVTQQIYDSSPEVQKFQQNQLNKLKERERLMNIKSTDRTEEQKKKIRQYAKYRGTDPRTGLKMWQFNPGSGRQIGYVLYHMMHYELPTSKDFLKPKAIQHRKQAHPETLTWEDYKTDRQVALPYIRDTYHEPLVDLLLRYSTDKKMISSVIDGYGKLLDKNSRLHSTFKIQGTSTGRLASSEPNAQNYKKPTTDVNDPNYNYSVKGLFYSRFKGGYLFNIDYKSLEVFIATLISHDTGMMQALMDGADIHKRNASIAFDIPYDEVDPEHRQLAKSVN